MTYVIVYILVLATTIYVAQPLFSKKTALPKPAPQKVDPNACPNCGKTVTPKDRFCSSCGTQIKGN